MCFPDIAAAEMVMECNGYMVYPSITVCIRERREERERERRERERERERECVCVWHKTFCYFTMIRSIIGSISCWEKLPPIMHRILTRESSK